MANKTKLYQAQELAAAYLHYRPHSYSEEVYKSVLSFCKESPSAGFSLAIDIGCGSGQSTLPLTKHFQKVIGLDVSEAQLARAPTNIPNLSFRLGSGEDLSFADPKSVDLVTVASALHFMDCKRVFAEVERVLKPGGAFVVYNYHRLPTLDDPRGREIYSWFEGDILGPHWVADAYNLEENYRGNYALPFPGWRCIDGMKIERRWTVDELVGYMSSLSAYQLLIQNDPSSKALEELKQKLKTVYEDNGEDGERKALVTWSLDMLMGHKPLDG